MRAPNPYAVSEALQPNGALQRAVLGVGNTVSTEATNIQPTRRRRPDRQKKTPLHPGETAVILQQTSSTPVCPFCHAFGPVHIHVYIHVFCCLGSHLAILPSGENVSGSGESETRDSMGLETVESGSTVGR